jgi:hypothetical protein
MRTRHFVRVCYLPLFVCLAACGGDAARSADPVVRDSAGIRIVENSAPRWPEGAGWRLSEVPVLDIGVLDGDPYYQLYRVSDAEKLSDGRIVVANSGTGELRFYDGAGVFLSSSGRKGGGPGEFEGLSSLWAQADSLLTFDYRHDRVSIFDMTGAFVRSFGLHALMGAGLFPDAEAPLTDGSFLITARKSSGFGETTGLTRDSLLFLHCDPEGAVLDTLGWFLGTEWYVRTEEQMVAASTRAFGRGPVTTVYGDGFYFGDSDSYEIGYHDATGSLTRLVRKAHTNLPVTAEDTELWIQERSEDADDENERIFFERMYAEMPFPETMPAYESIFVDAEGNLWVEAYRRPGDEQPRWTVFDRDGALLGVVETPPRFRIFQVGSDFVLGRWLDDLDVQHVRIYELLKERDAT